MRPSNLSDERNVDHLHEIEEGEMCKDDLTEEQLRELWRALLEHQASLQETTDLDAHKVKIRSHQVKAALARIESLDYGLCLKCFEPVGYKLLKEVPERRFCQQCDVKFRYRCNFQEIARGFPDYCT